MCIREREKESERERKEPYHQTPTAGQGRSERERERERESERRNGKRAFLWRSFPILGSYGLETFLRVEKKSNSL